MHILFLLDDIPRGLDDALTVRGHRVQRLEAAAAAAQPVRAELIDADLIVADSEVAERSELMARLTSVAPGIELILVGPVPATSHPDVLEHLPRPLAVDRVVAVVDELADVLDGERLREPIDLVAYETVFAGDSPQILDLVRRVRLVARSEAPVWIHGDDGSGRAIIARAIHDRSNRRREPFIAYNMAAYGDEELCKLLFHGDGGAVHVARTGTLFLERFATAGPLTQRELVHYLETRPKDGASARIIVGVQRALAANVDKLPLSSELYFQLKVLEVEIPRLEDRARDLEQIVRRMLERLAPGGKARVSAEAMRLLGRYNFPGNLLELSHALTHAFVLATGGAIEPEHLPASIRRGAVELDGLTASAAELEALDVVAKRFEREYLLQVLRNVGGNRGRAAEILGLSRKGLWGKLKAHGISDDEIEPED